ncbi:MAG: zinc-ribbon domain-containing protein [bacterium]
MIVQCDSCNSRYRIAEDKVLPQGIKVRCAKCKEVFVVKPLDESPQIDKPQPPAPEKKPEDEPAPSEPPPPVETPPEIPPAGKLPHAAPEQEPEDEPAPSEPPPEPQAKEPSSQPPLPPPGAKGTAPPAETTVPPEKETAPIGPEEALSSLIGTPSKEDFQPTTPDFTSGMEDKEPEPPAPDTPDPATEVKTDAPAGEPPPLPEEEPVSPALPDPGTSPDFEDVLPPLSQDIGSGQPAAAEGTPDPESLEWGNIALETESAQTPDQTDIDISPPEPAALDDLEEQPPHIDETVASYTKPVTGKIPKPDIRAKPPKKERKGLRLLLLLVLLLAAGYYNYPKIRNLLPSKSTAPQGDLAVENVQVSTLKRGDGVLLAAVRGNVRNKYLSNKGMIQVEAIFKGKGGKELARAAAYCGNLFSDNELASRDLSSIRTALENEFGQSLSNSSIAPESSVPFLIVMEDPPLDSKEVTVKVLKFSDTP